MKSQASKARKAQKKKDRRKAFERQSNILHSKPGMKGYRVIGKTAQKIEREKQVKQKALATNALADHSAGAN